MALNAYHARGIAIAAGDDAKDDPSPEAGFS
jgi:hypothetical protein